jgi:hypothetical protein
MARGPQCAVVLKQPRLVSTRVSVDGVRKFGQIKSCTIRRSDDKTSLHMRYEVRAPSQEPSWAVGAITEYADFSRK